MIKVSIIIPVYNVEKYIEKSIQCLLNQTLKELEFIFVDDCGQDNSISIVERYAQTDDRIKIIYKNQNEGAGKSRNIGIENANGEYLAFFDPDDTCDLDFYEKLYTTAKEFDCEIVKALRYPDKDALNHYIKNNLEKLKLYSLFLWQHTTAIYKKILIDRNFAKYGTTKVAEDLFFLLTVTYNCKSFKLIDNTYYYYYKSRTDSLATNKNSEFYMAEAAAAEERIKWLNSQKKFDESYYNYVYNGCLKHLINLYPSLFKNYSKILLQFKFLYEIIKCYNLIYEKEKVEKNIDSVYLKLLIKYGFIIFPFIMFLLTVKKTMLVLVR